MSSHRPEGDTKPSVRETDNPLKSWRRFYAAMAF
jgi:hypothetical protein